MLNTQRLSLLAWDNLGVGIIIHCHRVDFIVRKSRTTAFLHLVEDIGYTLVYVLVLFAEILRKEFIV